MEIKLGSVSVCMCMCVCVLFARVPYMQVCRHAGVWHLCVCLHVCVLACAREWVCLHGLPMSRMSYNKANRGMKMLAAQSGSVPKLNTKSITQLPMIAICDQMKWSKKTTLPGMNFKCGWWTHTRRTSYGKCEIQMAISPQSWNRIQDVTKWGWSNVISVPK